ncbi:hypothetical protein C4J93_2149 [Pseudomonas sp. R2-37-08W]|uniref:hypothetical protein n=1 Tax=unclassified Pseudomonas TaxID=196821 RepID=UPI000F582BBC|nr:MULTISPECIES: hypothetical protein [unclassified Pseudomonas]AZF10347.1 hypothetical protein C4J93_2149 [Pseudomonas sp. R2-37-08W]AZF20879.1 hypothetical protein C4J91_2129 [Pseudomonas sp. R3-52-08]
MSLSVTDRISIKFHNITGGNISSGRTLRIAEGLKETQNIPEKIVKLLSRKVGKHPELKQFMPQEVNTNLAKTHALSAVEIYNKGITQAKNELTGLQKMMNGHHEHVQKISNSILYNNIGIEFRAEVGGVLNELGSGFSNILKLEEKINNLNGDKYAIKQKIASHQKTKSNIIDMYGERGSLSPAWGNADRSISALEGKMSRKNTEIKTLESSLLDHREVLALSVITVAERREDLVSDNTQPLVNSYKSNFSELQSIPYKANLIEKSIIELQNQRENAVELADRIDHIQLLHMTNKVITDTNTILELTNNKILKLKSNIENTMQEQLAKAKEINIAISGIKSSDKFNVFSQEALSLPNVPNHKPDTTSSNLIKKRAELAS